MNDNDPGPVTVITGRAARSRFAAPESILVMLVAADEDSAVRRALDALTAEGFVSAELDQIGELDGMPDDEPHASAWQGAIEGEVSIVTTGRGR